jgi:GalNAc-alpha-(1->4)-GalNAc-alpha-(1->3)-diNAcBac-PP-undecaprenol alpha-1,4-N-acetyl-D-galactosaminyltransferase
VLSFDCPSGPRDLVRDGLDGVLVPPGDVGLLASWIERLVLDRELAERLGARAPEVLQRFSLPSVLRRWDAVLSEVTGRDLGSAEAARIGAAVP